MRMKMVKVMRRAKVMLRRLTALLLMLLLLLPRLPPSHLLPRSTHSLLPPLRLRLVHLLLSCLRPSRLHARRSAQCAPESTVRLGPLAIRPLAPKHSRRPRSTAATAQVDFCFNFCKIISIPTILDVHFCFCFSPADC
jgi:hypothetical protein